MKKYYVASKESGDFIDSFETVTEAAQAIKKYEEQDKEEGIYEDDFYEIETEDHSSVVED